MRCAPGVSASATSEDRLHRHLGVRARGARRGAQLEPVLVVTRPPAARGRGRRVAPTPVAIAARERGFRVREPAAAGGGRRRDRRARARARRVCAPTGRSCASRCCRATRSSTCTPRSCRAGAAPRRSSARSWPATRPPGCRSCGSSRSSTPAGVSRAESSQSSRRTTTARSATRLAALGGALLVEALEGPREYVARTPPGSPTPRRSRRPTASSSRAARRPRSSGSVRALHPHIGARLPDGLGVVQPRATPGAERPHAAAGAGFGATTGRSSCTAAPGGRRWTLELPARATAERRRAMERRRVLLRGHAL